MTDSCSLLGLNPGDRILKRTFDFVAASIALTATGWLIALTYLLAAIDTRKDGFFKQLRVGKNGKLFHTIKIRTMRDIPSINTTVTVAHDPRITTLGRFFRRSKIDELPQLINILLGDMSFVGPRPDVPSFADQLTGDDRIILSVRPGLTGPATLEFRDEERLLAGAEDPERYNREVIYPEKVRLNKEYIRNYSLKLDLVYILRTLSGIIPFFSNRRQ